MHPGFKLNEYKVYRKKKQQKEDQQTQYQQQQQQLLQFQMNQPIEHIIDESAYWIEVEKTVKRLLKLLQKGEPEDRQVTVDVIKTLQPQIYNTVSFSFTFCINSNTILFSPLTLCSYAKMLKRS